MSDDGNHGPKNKLEPAPPNSAPGGAVRYWLGWWISCAVLWIVLAGKFAPDEMAFGAAAAVLAATAATAVKEKGRLDFETRREWWRQLLPLPKRVLSDSGTLLAILWQRLVRRRMVTGPFLHFPFAAATGDDPVSVTHRALVVVFSSLPPNSYIIDIEAERGTVAVHQLAPAPGSGDPEWPV